uniref:Uncharacterized protein n=1 Tax=Myoviridae sp. ct1ba2 TaxID=2827654 RepID=A0A8S5S6Z2_9CAUD|nr:MAG TPA: Protein of unknown function (DUF2624) [Myoviridae sp. ct1ba2]
MRDKQYQFNLTEKQIDMINDLIKKEFQNELANNREELISLGCHLNFELGFNKGIKEFGRVEDDD